MRPRLTLAGITLTAVLAFVAGPGIAGAITPARPAPVPAAAFRPLTIAASDRSPIGPLDGAYDSLNALRADVPFAEPGGPAPVLPTRVPTTRTQPGAVAAVKQGRYQVHGLATFYDNGTTAMRLPRGTLVRICGAGGCVERTITDYGPQAATGRIVDMTPQDFQAICACGFWVGVQRVTVDVY